MAGFFNCHITTEVLRRVTGYPEHGDLEHQAMSIDDWRGEIDDIDREIVRLLNALAGLLTS